MNPLQALVLGIVQGLTEFLPISSSAHLVLFPFVAGWGLPSVAFDVAVHLGTLLAVVWVFRDRLIEIARSLASRVPAGGPASDPGQEGHPGGRRTLRLLIVATVPAIIFGVAAESRIEDTFKRPVVVSLLLGITGWALFAAERRAALHEPERGEDSIADVDAGIIGVAQAASIFPGISRSGSTIATGMMRGLTRSAAARFSFLMSIPVIFGAGVLKIPDMLKEGANGQAGAIALGFLSAAATGIVAIRWFLGVIERRSLKPFGTYCFLAMATGLLTALARG